MFPVTNNRSLIVLLSSIPAVIAELNGFYNPLLYRTSHVLYWCADFTSFVLVPSFLVYWLATYANIWPKHYGLQFLPRMADFLGTSALLGFILFITYFVARYIGWVLTWRWYTPSEFTYGTAIPHGLFRLPAVLYMSATAGIVESIFLLSLPWYFWRNFLNLAHRRNSFAWLSSVVFASCHWEQGLHNVIAAFAFNYVACYLYWKLNDLWPIIGAHVLVDIVEFF